LKPLPVATAATAIMMLGALPAQAWADTGGITIDEPTNLALLALGFVGLVVGRRAARRKD